ncbi:Zn-dependent exopeptidase M28 [bacterium]|nr:Zn-dependent exopeptidase M28 [bacterium]
MQVSRSNLMKALWTLLPASLIPATGFAMGHGPLLSIEHFNSQPQTVWLKIQAHSRSGSQASGKIAQFEMGGGKQIQILKTRPESTVSEPVIEVPWPAGYTLAFVEGHAPTSGKLVAGLKYRGLYLMKSPEAVQLQKDARNFVWPVSMEDAVIANSSSTIERGTTPSQPLPPWQPRAVSKAEALQPDLGRITQTLDILSGERPFMLDGKEVRITERGGADNRVLTQKFVMQTLQDLGIEARLVPYTYSGYNGANVEGTLWGADRSRFIILSGHMDSVRNRGVDDDGSGTAGMLEAARLLAAKGTLPVSIRFVGFDQEELGLIGSRAYANQINSADRILGVVQADMIGYDSNGDLAYHAMDCDRPDSVPLTRVVDELNVNLSLGMKKVSACTNRSDHASFWNKNIPALILSENFFGGDSNPCYHQKCDLMDKINKDYLLKLASLQVNTTLSLALSAN